MRTTLLAGATAAALSLALPAAAQEAADYNGDLHGMNGVDVSGTVSFKTTDNGRLVMSIGARGVPPGTRLVHVHGFGEREPAEATCPGPDADRNGDGIVDVVEAAKASGGALIPFSGDPGAMNATNGDYPRADADGTLSRVQEVELPSLESAVERAEGTPLALETRVVFVHGAPPDATLPESVASLADAPAAQTLPIACAELSRKPIDR